MLAGHHLRQQRMRVGDDDERSKRPTIGGGHVVSGDRSFEWPQDYAAPHTLQLQNVTASITGDARVRLCS